MNNDIILEEDGSESPPDNHPIPSQKEAEITPEVNEMLMAVRSSDDYQGVKVLIYNHIASHNADLYTHKDPKYAHKMDALFALLGSFDSYA